jgi:hypothetical protein
MRTPMSHFIRLSMLNKLLWLAGSYTQLVAKVLSTAASVLHLLLKFPSSHRSCLMQIVTPSLCRSSSIKET